VTNQYQSHGVNMSNVNFLVALSDSYWTRDYGPWYICYGDDQIGIIDFIYNRPNRPHDDTIPQEIAGFLDEEWFGMDVIHTGGNYMTDGYHISSSSELVWEENPTMTHAEIEQAFSDYLGIETYHVIPDPNNTYIDHIDCWGKFLDVDKVLIREVPSTHPQYDEIEATADYYASHISAWGIPYHVYRVWTPNNEPYTNSLILNNRVFVPITGSQWDDEAIVSYEAAMPGYEILGFTGSWESTDALHCRANGIADRNMLFIEHYPLLGDLPVQTEYEIATELTAYSGYPVIDDQVKVFYSINGGSYQEMIMTHTGGKLYTATLPGAAYGSEIDYYITASDQSGKNANHPFIGEADPHVFFVGEQLFPEIAVNVTEINAWVNQGYTDTEEFSISNNGQIDLNFSIDWTSAVFEEFDYSVTNSPNQYAWNSNTFTELGWTEFEIENTSGEIGDWSVSFHWQTDNYPEEGTFRVMSPDGTQAIIAAGMSTGDYTCSLDVFNGEQMQGTWRVWITDSYGDGGHRATNITVTVTKTYEIYPWLTVEPASGQVTPGNTQTISAICNGSVLPLGDYEGTIYISSNDPENSFLELPVHFHVDYASGLINGKFDEPVITVLPNPFKEEVSIEFIINQSANISLSIFDALGKKVKWIPSDDYEGGKIKLTWDGTNEERMRLNQGIYFYRLRIGNFEKRDRLILLD
ncbi:MAG: T9SS type A sorting domain-containing protein, partial [Bacteroidetes bacterium]|nr:T9SS type A sorting domain-containing protein [Bacteroidota bacterium]